MAHRLLRIRWTETGELDWSPRMLSVHNITAAPDNHCFEHWHEVTCRNYSITEYRRPVTGPFRGQITARRFGALTVSDVYSSFSDCGIEVTRGSGEIRRDPRDHFMLYLVCCGEVGVDQDGARHASARATFSSTISHSPSRWNSAVTAAGSS
jgi:hypothetical protein